MLDSVNKNKKNIYIIIGVLIIQTIYMACCFNFEKQGFHSDELWSYGFANSNDGPYIYMNNDETEFKNINQWVDSSVLKDYITLDKSEIFNYKMVYENCAYDMHPPLYFMLIHLVSSFAVGKFSKWFAFLINLFAFVLAQVFLYKLIRIITKDDIFALLGILYYGFTMGAVNDTIYLRNYSLCTAFVVMTAYYSTEVYYHRHEEKKQWGYIIKSGIAILLGSLTVHFSLPIAFIIVLMYCLFYLFSKNIKLMFKYGIVMAVSVGLSILMFWPTINHVFSDRRVVDGAVNYPAAWQFKIYWAYLQRDIIGFRNSIWPSMTDTYLMLGLAGLIFILIPVCFIFRNEDWFKDFVAKFKNAVKTLWEKRKHFQYPILVMFVSVNFLLLISAFETSIYFMGEHSRRYIFIIYPLYCCFILTFFYFPVKWIFKNKKTRNIVITVLLCITITVVYVSRTKAFFFAYSTEGMSLEEIEDDANTVLLLNSPFLLTCVTDKLMDTAHFYETNIFEFKKNDNYFEIDTKNAPLYLALDSSAIVSEEEYEMAVNEGKVYVEGVERQLEGEINVDAFVTLNQVLDYYETLFECEAEYKGLDNVFGRQIIIYKFE
ncbi:MAG: hypothetical protein IJV15_15000 [Lachnospiraceae bacterium]|nr:hypothetical protein [Lachnospiraceae bacterium]